ncbi:Receptor tyrosine-protein kinase erbB-3 [Merluccius polli]|uniref:receptor protein-tyrosine kinase n=1 Tax=Merluccius polli TaxID=89951 RepID=A0AA47P558_MERPO|nr:Receptor tyrosine-protein kinase erbB-3 [Merluccius polli]
MSPSDRPLLILHILYILLLWLIPPCATQTQEVTVCSGTQNALSMTGSSDMQYKFIKEMYTGCEIVMGNLEITMMEHGRDFSFLQSIREVTGYILIAVNRFRRLPLDHLRVIRGTTLFEDRFALAVLINYQKDGQHGLQELRLTHLTEILEGGVQIIQNKFLSFAPQINWLDIVKDGTSEIILNSNGPEKHCHKACSDVPCWGPGNDTCQILTKTVCAPQCNDRCFGKSPSECCHIECAGGCLGPLDTDCFACRNFNNSGSCVPQCPQTLIYNKHTFKLEPNPSAKYQYGSICVAQCPPNFVVDESSCVSSCPSDKMEVEKKGVKRCEPCGGPCPKVCIGTDSTDRQTVDALNIDSFRNCTKIQGSLCFLVTGINGDDYKNIPAIDPEKLKIFSTVREITDFLNIQSWPANMSDLSVFANLQTIEGRTLYSYHNAYLRISDFTSALSIRGYALLVMRIPSVTSLGLRSLRRINDGGVYITRNPKLCYQDKVNWTSLFSGNSRQLRRTKNIDIKDNRARSQCVKDGHVCDPLCSSDGCWGPGPNQCLACKNYSIGGTCVPQCMFLTGSVSSQYNNYKPQSHIFGECLPCPHAETLYPCVIYMQAANLLTLKENACPAIPSVKSRRGSQPALVLGRMSVWHVPDIRMVHTVSTCPMGLMGGEGVIFKYPNRQHSCEPCHINLTVCSGTQNALSMTGSSDMQYKFIKEMYTGCEIVMGNLEITMMEPGRDFSFLQSIREVTGYILIAVNQFSRLPLDHLRVIRGTTLFEDRFALAVLVNYQKDGQHGLQELRLTHLTEILEGGVQIIQNKFLSFAPQINWLDIVKDGTSEIILNSNGPEKHCHKACSDVPCWGPGNDTCQIPNPLSVSPTVTKTVCAPQCNDRCFGKSPSECCHIECAGGCLGPLDTDCFACRNFNNSGSCVPQCPQTLIYNKHTFKLEPNPSAKYQYGSICVAQCPPNFVVDESSCVSSCPSDKMEVEKKGVKRCEPCGGPCPKVCIGTDSTDRQTVDALNIDSFRNCTKIQGSLCFLVTGINGDDYKNIPAIDPEKLKIFSTVREITDFLNIQSWPANMSDLSVFANLQTIEGRTLYSYHNAYLRISDFTSALSIRGYALLVMRIPSVTSLGLRSLRRINDGGVYITRNPKLCYQDKVNWTSLFSGNSRQLRRTKNIDIKDNRARSQCVKDGHVCDPLCSSDGCWGPGPNQCLACKNYSIGGTCVPQCMFLTGSVSSQYNNYKPQSHIFGECLPCPHAETLYPCVIYMQAANLLTLKENACPAIPSVKSRRGSQPALVLQTTTGIVLGVIAFLFVGFSIFVLTVLYRRGLAIRRKRAMRRYMESGEGDCSAQDSAPDEHLQRTTDLEGLNGELDDQEAEGLKDSMATLPLYMSPSRSLSRLSRMDSMRVTPSSVAGYLPMTPGVDTTGQGLWQSRSRLNSARTMSESSEGRGTITELEINEDFSLTGSLRRKRQREDSAYLSQRDSMSGGPPETPSPDIENEEDQNGYVLPGESPKRETLLFVAKVTPFKDRMCIVHSPGPPSDPDDEEYEYMNKQTTSLQAKHRGQFKDNSSWLQIKDMGGHTSNEDKDAFHSSSSEDQASLEYEYMDIRGSETEENNPPQTHEVPPRTMVQEHPNIAREVLDEVEEDDYYQEDDNYQHTNRQPKLRQALQDRKEGKGPRRGDNYEEYEEMNSLAALGAEELAVYQNLQGEEEGAVKGTEGHQASGIDLYVKVRAGVEPGGVDRSFDNPDYWHSRMFLKSNAVRT